MGARRGILIALGAIVGAIVLVYAVAYFLIPKDWIEQQARFQAGKVQGATIRWDHLSTGLSGFSLGIRVHGLRVRVPAEGQGDPTLDARTNDVFVRFRLLPLLSRRVEVSAAEVNGAGIAMFEHPEAPPGAGTAKHPQLALFLPRLDLHDVAIRSRDRYGSGMDVTHLEARAEFEGALDHPQAVRVHGKADSLYWKPSAQGAAVALPSPLALDLELEGSDHGQRLTVTKGTLNAGPIAGDIRGDVRLPATADAKPELALIVSGNPQRIDSGDKAFRGLASLSPAGWSTTASFRLDVTGDPSKPVQAGRFTLKPVDVQSGSNRFSLDQVLGSWSTDAAGAYAVRADGAGDGVAVALDARGELTPGSASHANLVIRAPAARLNGIVPNTPNWKSGILEVHAAMSLNPPAPPSVRWTLSGRGLSGDIQGFRRPLNRLDFDFDGDERTASIHSLDAFVGSTHASVTGTFHQGKPLGTGTFEAKIDRLVAEEWTPPSGKGGAPGPSSPPGKGVPLPLRSFDGTVSIGEVRSGKMVLRNVVAPIKFAGGNLVASPITAALGTGSLTGDFAIQKLVTQPSYAMNVKIDRVPVQELMASVTPVKLGISGATTGTMSLSGNGLPGLDMGSLGGGLKGVVENGKVLETPAIRNLRSALGLVSGSAAASPGSLPDIAFKALSYGVKIDKGRLVIDQFGGEIGKDLLAMTGSAGFDKSIDLNLMLGLASTHIKPETFLAGFAKYARDEQGRLPLKIRMTGNTLAPKISVSPASTAEAIQRGLAQDLLKRLEKQAVADTGRVARGDTSHAASAAADTVRKGAPPKSTKAEKQLKEAEDALRRLLHK